MREPLSRLLLANLTNTSEETFQKYSRKAGNLLEVTKPFWSEQQAQPDTHCLAFLATSYDIPPSSSTYRKDDNNLVAFFDGYLSNRQELAALLPTGQPLEQGAGEAQLVLALYESLGEDFIKHLNGWFAVIIFDRQKNQTIVGTDRLGMYPLYFHQNQDGSFLASDIHMLFHMGVVQPELDQKGLSDYWVYGGVLHNHTLFKGITRIPPASFWVCRPEGKQETIYFDHSAYDALEPIHDVEQAVQTGMEVLAQVMPDHCLGGASRNYFLSGGWDTRVLSAHLSQEAARNLHCVTYGCDPRLKDRPLAQKIAAHLQCDHQFIHLGPALLEQFPTLAFDAIYLTDGLGCAENAISLFILDSVQHPTSFTVTGKFGSEFIRGAEGVLGNHDLSVLNPELRPYIQEETIDPRPHGWFGDTTLSYKDHLLRRLDEVRSVWGGNVRAERYKTWTMAPYVDNRMVELMFRMPEPLRQGDNLLHKLVRHDPVLAAMPTNRGEFAVDHGMLDALTGQYYHLLWYSALVANSTRLPNWLRADLLPLPTQRISKWKTWYRDTLKQFVLDILLDPQTLNRGILDPAAVRRVLDNDFAQLSSLTVLNRMLSVEMAHRVFLD